MKMQNPPTYSAADTARAVSRRMNKAGFKMSVCVNGRSTPGYYVHRIGCGSTVHIGFSTASQHYQQEDHAIEIEARNEAIAFLRNAGYNVSDIGYIKCEHE